MHANALQPDLGLVLAHARLYERLAERAIERRRSSSNAGPLTIIGRAAARLRAAISEPAATASTTMPRLDGYPYRG